MLVRISKELWVSNYGFVPWVIGRAIDLRPDVRQWCQDNRVRYSMAFEIDFVLRAVDSRGAQLITVPERRVVGVKIGNKRKATLFKLWWG